MGFRQCQGVLCEFHTFSSSIQKQDLQGLVCLCIMYNTGVSEGVEALEGSETGKHSGKGWDTRRGLFEA